MRYYGWAFNNREMLEYAKRHEFTFKVDPNVTGRRFGSKGTVKFSEITEEHCRDEKPISMLSTLAIFRIQTHIAKKAGVLLTFEKPLSADWEGMWVLWTNYDIQDKWPRIEALRLWDRLQSFMDGMMNEGRPADAEPRRHVQWWWSCFNNFVSVSRSCCVQGLAH